MNSIFFDSVATTSGGVTTYDRAANAADLRKCLASFIANGVYINPSNNLQVLAGSGMTVTVKTGKCWINGAFGWSTSDEEITVSTADATNPRITTIIARYSTASAKRNIELMAVDGTAAISPVAPTPTQTEGVYDIVLAQIRVAAGATSITQSDITDTRQNTSICGVVHAVFTQADTTTLFAQFQSAFDTWFTRLENYWDDQTVATLQAAIDTHASRHAVDGADPLTLAISQITNLTTTLAGKAASSHSHAISDITNLSSQLAAKAAATVDISKTLSTSWTTATSSTTPSSSACAYYQTVTVSGITADTKAEFGLPNGASDAVITACQAAGWIQVYSQSANSITFMVKVGGTKPTVAIPIVIRVIG